MQANSHLWRRAFWGLCIGHLIVWTLVPLFAYPNITLDTAEATAWGHQWQWGYFKHPPLSGWVAEIGRIASGSQSTWGVYLVAQLVIVAAFFFVWRLSLRVVEPAAAFLAVLGLEASFVYTVQTIEFNVNTMMLPFVAMAAWCGHQAITDGRWKWWIGLGIAMGLGFLSKYIMALEAAAMGGFFLCHPAARLWLRKPQPYVAMLICLLVFAPNLHWLLTHHLASIGYAQSRAVSLKGPAGRIIDPLQFILSQLMFVAPMALTLLPWTGFPWRRNRSTDPHQRMTAWFVLVVCLAPPAFLTLLSAITGIQLHSEWGVPLWPLFALLILLWVKKNPAASPSLSVKLGLAFAAFNIILACGLLPALTAMTHGRPLRYEFSGEQLTQQVDQMWKDRTGNSPLPLIGGERWLADNIAFYSPDRPSVLADQGNLLDYVDFDPANCSWTSLADFHTRGGMIVWYADLQGSTIPDSVLHDFPQAQLLGTISIPWHYPKNAQPRMVGIAIVMPHRT